MNIAELLTDGGIIFILVLVIQEIKKFMPAETVVKWEGKKGFQYLYIGVCLPVAVLICMKNGVFENTIIQIIGECALTFISMAVVGGFFYDAIIKKLLKKKANMENED